MWIELNASSYSLRVLSASGDAGAQVDTRASVAWLRGRLSDVEGKAADLKTEVHATGVSKARRLKVSSPALALRPRVRPIETGGPSCDTPYESCSVGTGRPGNGI